MKRNSSTKRTPRKHPLHYTHYLLALCNQHATLCFERSDLLRAHLDFVGDVFSLRRGLGMFVVCSLHTHELEVLVRDVRAPLLVVQFDAAVVFDFLASNGPGQIHQHTRVAV